MPVTIVCNHETYLKKQPSDAATLPSDQKVLVPFNKQYSIDVYNPCDENGHRLITLSYGAGSWYVFSKHWNGLPVGSDSSYNPANPLPPGWSTNEFGLAVPPSDSNDFKLPVPYFSQLDNQTQWQGPGNRQCRSSSNAMVVDALLAGELSSRAAVNGFRDADSYWGYRVDQKGYDTTEPTGHILVAQDFNLTIPFATTGTLSKLRHCLRLGLPAALGMAYKSSGHYVSAVGLRGSSFYIHDPYGVRDGSSNQYGSTNGAYDTYTEATMNAIWLDLGSGWWHVPTAINGQPTGVVS